jgi:hypothetical protein
MLGRASGPPSDGSPGGPPPRALARKRRDTDDCVEARRRRANTGNDAATVNLRKLAPERERMLTLAPLGRRCG